MLPADHHKSIYLYLSLGSWAQVAKKIGVAEKTLWEWRKNAEYQECYQKAVDALNQDVLARLPEFEHSALEVLSELMLDSNNAPRERREAANSILVHGRKCREYLMNRRLEAKLEQSQQFREELERLLDQETCLKL